MEASTEKNLRLRGDIVTYVESMFVGPQNLVEQGETSEEVLTSSPLVTFSSGSLHPKLANVSDEEIDDEDDPEKISTFSEGERPSCIGIETRLTDLNQLEKIHIKFAKYRRFNAKDSSEGNRVNWKRKPYSIEVIGSDVQRFLNGKIFYDLNLADGVKLRIITRVFSDATRLKLFLVNDWSESVGGLKTENVVYQPTISLTTLSGTGNGFIGFPDRSLTGSDIEDRCMKGFN